MFTSLTSTSMYTHTNAKNYVSGIFTFEYHISLYPEEGEYKLKPSGEDNEPRGGG
jgi:hypothetical protein